MANVYRIHDTIINLNHVLATELDDRENVIYFRVTRQTYESLKSMYRDVRVNWGDGSPYISVKFKTHGKAKEEFEKLASAPVVAELVGSQNKD